MKNLTASKIITKRTVIITSIVIIILLAALYIIFLKPKPIKSQPTNTLPDTTLLAVAKPVNKNSAPTTNNIPMSISSNAKMYYAVAGCFEVESNADGFVSKLRDKGFNSLKFGKLGTLHCVSFNSFSKKSEAIEEINKIISSGDTCVWLLYY